MNPNIKEFLISLFFPKHCPFCGHLMEATRTCCEKCEPDLPWTDDSEDGSKYPFLDQMYVPLFYSGLAATAVKVLKFHGKRAYSRSIGQLMAQYIQKREEAVAFDCILPIPMTEKDIRKRGYSQSQLLARFMGETLQIPVWKDRLIKVQQTEKQHLLNAEQRRENLKGAFMVTNPEAFKGKSILLCDDVVTTGSTLREAADTLRAAGASHISAAVVTIAGKSEIHIDGMDKKW